jgi:protein TonB
MSRERALYRTPIVGSVLLHAAVLVPVLMPREPPGLAEGAGGSGFAVSIAATDGATGAPGAETPDIETIDARANPDAVSATVLDPEEGAAEAAPEPLDATTIAQDLPIVEPDAADGGEAEPVAAAVPEPTDPAPAPEPEPPARAWSEATEVPLEEVQAQSLPAAPVGMPAMEDSAVATEEQPPPDEPAEQRAETPPVKTDSIEIGERTMTTAGAHGGAPSRASGDGGMRSADAGSDVASIDSGAPAGSADYSSLLLAWLEKHKKYPRRARLRHWQGTAVLQFAIDRSGNVLDYRIARSSGHAVLDEEVEAMIRRAAPLPPAPPEMRSARLEFVVPVQFVLD